MLNDEGSYEEISASAGIAAAMLNRGNPLHSKYINKSKIISGATILGDGEVALIIDANALF